MRVREKAAVLSHFPQIFRHTNIKTKTIWLALGPQLIGLTGSGLGGGGEGRSEDEKTDVKFPDSRNFSPITKNGPNKNCTLAEIIELLKMGGNKAECFVLSRHFLSCGVSILVDFLKVQYAKIKP